MTAAAAMGIRYLHLAAFKSFHSTLFFCDVISGYINHQLDLYPMAFFFFFFFCLTLLRNFFFSCFPPCFSWPELCVRLVPIRSFLPLWIEYCLEEEIPFNPANAGVWLLRFDYSSPHTHSFLTRGQISWCTKLARGKDLCKVAPTGHVHQTWYAWPNGLLPCIHCSIS